MHFERTIYLIQLVSTDVSIRSMIRVDEKAALAVRAEPGGGVLVAQFRFVLVILTRLDAEDEELI